jgi:small membrane protein
VDALTTFQWIAFVLLAVPFLATVTLTVRRTIGPRVGFAWGLLWIAAAVLIARPELTAIVARALGIGRGTDLVFYVAILAMGFGFFTTYVRLRRIEGNMTKLVRELALRSAEVPRSSDVHAGAPVDVDDSPRVVR